MSRDTAEVIEGIEGICSEEDAFLEKPFYFSGDNRQLFGWLHQPAPARPTRWGIVVCKPFGYEALCAHRSIRAFANQAAELGIPTLRFDYLGTGDSADIDPLADQTEQWIRDITYAVAELRGLGVEHVCLMGFRLGALLAIRAAKQCRVSALALIAPVLSGRRYLREARTLQLAASATESSISSGRTPIEDAIQNPGSLEVSGHPLSAASVSSLTRLEAALTDIEDLSNLLVIDRNDISGGQALTQMAETHGVRAEYHALPGFIEMMMTAPQFSKLPEQMLSRTCAWLRHHLATPGPVEYGHATTRMRVAGTTPKALPLELRGEDAAPNAIITERPVFIDSDVPLFGVVTEPGPREARRRAVILLNSGAVNHIGASRMYVSLARSWGRYGYHVMRMDLASLGDSPTRPGRLENQVFPTEAMEDIRAAIEFMCTRYDIRDVTLAGLCSGAYHALRAAISGLPVNRVLMVNAQNYHWDEGMSLDGLQLAEVIRNPTIYREQLLSAAAWRRFFTGQVNLWRIVKIYVRRPLLELQSLLRDLARSTRIRLPHDLGRDLEDIIARGIRVVFVFARGEPGLDLLKIEAGSIVNRLGDSCRIRIIDSADHTFSRSGPRLALERVLSEELFSRSPH